MSEPTWRPDPPTTPGAYRYRYRGEGRSYPCHLADGIVFVGKHKEPMELFSRWDIEWAGPGRIVEGK